MARTKKDVTDKDPFADLPAEFKDKLASMNEVDIRKEVSKVALDEEENVRLKEEDLDLKALKEQVKEASKVYRESSKENRLKIKFARRVLEDQGKA
jgi:hypothetical protein